MQKKLGVTLLRFRGYSVWKATLILKLNLAHVGQYGLQGFIVKIIEDESNYLAEVSLLRK